MKNEPYFLKFYSRGPNWLHVLMAGGSLLVVSAVKSVLPVALLLGLGLTGGEKKNILIWAWISEIMAASILISTLNVFKATTTPFEIIIGHDLPRWAIVGLGIFAIFLLFHAICQLKSHPQSITEENTTQPQVDTDETSLEIRNYKQSKAYDATDLLPLDQSHVQETNKENINDGTDIRMYK